jgi:hypothetical protein
MKMKIIDKFFVGWMLNLDIKVSKGLQRLAAKAMDDTSSCFLNCMHKTVKLLASVLTFMVAIELSAPLISITMHYKLYRITVS